jgi:DegV family protein with EDD domain
VQVFDSLNLSWGLAFQVLDAASAAAEGLSLAEALDRVTSVRDRVQLIVGLDRLDNLAKGGRIGRVSALFGSLLNLKVAFCVAPDGAFEPLFRARGEKAALAQALDWVSEKMGTANSGKFAVGHALSPERAERIAAALRERFHASEMIMYETGSVISTHTGTGWGIAFVPEA